MINNVISLIESDNPIILMIVCIAVICITVRYIQPFNASRIETILMSKSDETKKTIAGYIVSFLMLVVGNIMFTMDKSIVVIEGIILIVTYIVSLILKKLQKKSVAKKQYEWLEDRKSFIYVIFMAAIIIFFVAIIFKIQLVKCILIGALAEVLILAITLLNVSNVRTIFYVDIKGEKWYVFKRMKDGCLLCGNKDKMIDSKKIRLVKMDYILEHNICLKRKINEIKK